jgi:hypothetical protein
MEPFFNYNISDFNDGLALGDGPEPHTVPAHITCPKSFLDGWWSIQDDEGANYP